MSNLLPAAGNALPDWSKKEASFREGLGLFRVRV